MKKGLAAAIVAATCLLSSGAFAQSGAINKAVGGYSWEDAAKEAPTTKKDGKPQYPETPSQRLSPGYAAQTSEGNPRLRVEALGPAILTRCKTSLIADWLAPTKKTPELHHLRLGVLATTSVPDIFLS